jgi:RNA polymerase sigma-70 factor (ECF subfamily)
MTEVDEHTVIRARQGDAAARGDLVRVWHPVLLSGALRLLGYRRHDAEEAVQESWILIFQGLTQLRVTSSWRFWIHSILRNVCLRQLQKRSRPLPSGMEKAEPEAEETLEGSEKARLSAAVQAMPPAYREAVVLRYFQKLSYAEVAAALSISTGTAKSNVHKGLAWLERRLGGVVSSHD